MVANSSGKSSGFLSTNLYAGKYGICCRNQCCSISRWCVESQCRINISLIVILHLVQMDNIPIRLSAFHIIIIFN